MNRLETLLDLPPYGLDKAEKSALYAAEMPELTAFHRAHCPPYGRLLDALGGGESAPFLPVSVFKELELKSIPEEAVYKTLTSSGTTGQRPSKIYLDQETARWQQRVLVHIVSDLIGKSRLPMLVLDTKAVLRDRKRFSARGAGILGFSVFSSSMTCALDENMALDLSAVMEFAEKNRGKKVLLFGFTYMTWDCVLEALRSAGKTVDLSGGVLIHGGGWKKLADRAVTNERFRAAVREYLGVGTVRDYYGMAEQAGSIFMECGHGHLHASVWSDVVIRRPSDYGACAVGEEGVIQVLSPLPRSYPGHSLLTEDIGVLLGEDDCPCGRKGKYFRVLGRTPAAEARGCGDTYD